MYAYIQKWDEVAFPSSLDLHINKWMRKNTQLFRKRSIWLVSVQMTNSSQHKRPEQIMILDYFQIFWNQHAHLQIQKLVGFPEMDKNPLKLPYNVLFACS